MLVAALFVFGLPMAVALPEPGVPATPSPDELLTATKDYIVGFHDAIPRGLEVGSEFHGGTVVQVNIDLVWAVVRTDNPVQFQIEARQDASVRYIEWDDPYKATLSFVPNDSRYNDAGHWGSKRIGAETAWDTTLGSTAITVGMLDSGLNKGHEDISRYLQGYDFVDNDSNPQDTSGCSYHGTHTSGTAGATINNGKGIAGMSQHTILPVRAFYSSLFGCTSGTTQLANALQYIGDQGAHLSSNSWSSGGSSTTLNDAVQYAHDRGVRHVAAAGNAGPCSNCVSYPWRDKASITIVVSSSTSSDGFSSFSSEGPQVDLIAPGSNILSTTSGTAGYGSLSGTSMATPHVTGTAALVLAVNPSLSFSALETLLKDNAENLGMTAARQGAGLVRADWAVAAAGGGGPNPQCSDGVDNDGDGLIDYPSDPGCSSASDNDETNAPPPPPPGTVFSENFDAGSAPGWTVNSGTLWHLNTGCGTAHTGSWKLVWASSSTCTYDVGDTGLDWVKTPAISLSGYSSATLKFWHWFETESFSGGAYDVLRVQRSCDNSAWTTMQQWDSRNSNVLSWTQQTYDVSACAGGNLWVRWTADSIDGSFNNYDGWRIDTVEVTAS